MRYPIAIETGDSKHAYGVVVPDLPGCFSAGDTLDEALTNATKHAAGAEVTDALTEKPYGGRGYGASDLEGHHWSFGGYRPDLSGSAG